MPTTRRAFLATAGSSLLMATLSSRASAAPAPLPIIDTHQHLWDLDKFRLPWLGKEGKLARSFATKDYLAAVAGLNVEQAVYMEVDVADDQKLLEAEYVLELSQTQDQPTKSAVIGGRPATEAFAEYARRFRDQPAIKGFRQVISSSKQDGTFVKNLRLLGELDKSYDLCLPGSELGEIVKVIDQCPDTRMVLDHCGNPDLKAFLPEDRRGPGEPSHSAEDWKRSIDAIALRENVICKISGIIAGVPKQWSTGDLAPIVNHCLDCFGPQRVVFGSDWPVCLMGATLAEWVATLKQVIADRPLADQRALLAENARRFYKLATQ